MLHLVLETVPFIIIHAHAALHLPGRFHPPLRLLHHMPCFVWQVFFLPRWCRHEQGFSVKLQCMTTPTTNALPAHRRHDISDRVWLLLEPLLPGRRGVWGGIAKDNRLFINAIFWILRTGAPWRDLPPDYGDWKNTHRRFCRWRDKGVWAQLLEALITEPDFEWLMIDATHAKVHPHAAGARGGNQAMGVTKGG